MNINEIWGIKHEKDENTENHCLKYTPLFEVTSIELSHIYFFPQKLGPSKTTEV